MLGLGRRDEGGPESGAYEADSIRPRPDFLGDPRRDARTAERHEDAVIKTGVVHPRKNYKRSRGKISQTQVWAPDQRMGGGQQNAVSFLQQQSGVQLGCGCVRVKKTAGEGSGVERRQLRRRRRFVKLHAHPRKSPVELPEDAGKHRCHREAGERNSDVAELT